MAKRKGLDPDDVIAGRSKPGVADLLDLIHRENPTGRELGPREAEMRYARKARLQSLLVRRFAEDLEVALDPERPGTVSLLHRGHGRDGCHAVLASLDDDARSWVQRELDLAAQATPEPVPSARPSKRGGPRDSVPSARPSGRGAPPPAFSDAALAETPEELLRRGEAAIEAYDYEVAQTALTRATEASGGAPGPAAKLLSLLVETLGDDAAALAVEPILSRAAMADPRVRGPLALAATRAGLEDRALDLVSGIDDPDAAAVLASLAARALSSGDVDRAARHLDQARRHDPTSAAARAVAGDLAKARAAERQPFEADLRALLEAGDDVAAEKKADDLLSRWPDSEAARRAKHGVEERRRAAREAEVRRARELEALAREKQDAERVEETIRALAAADAREGLIAYSTLEQPLRDRARLRSTRLELAWIDAMPSARPAALAGAATALAEARALLPHDPDGALSKLAPHAALLERVGEATRATRAAEALLRARRLERARAHVEAARTELANGKAEEAIARLPPETLRELPKEERAVAEAIEAEARAIVDRERRRDEVRRHREEGRLFEARALAEGLVDASTDPAERAWARGTCDSIQADIQLEFRVDVLDAPRTADDLGRLRGIQHGDPPWWLTADGRSVVIARSHERWVVVRVLDLATKTVRPTVVLRTPEAMGDLDTTVCGTSLWLVGSRGAVAEIDMVTWQIRDFCPAAEVIALADAMESATLVVSEDRQSPPYLWVTRRTRGELGEDASKVIHLPHRRPVRDLPDAWHAVRIAGPGEPRVVSQRGEIASVHTARGAAASPGRLELRRPGRTLSLNEIAAHPAGEGFVALVSPPMFDELQEMVEDRTVSLATFTAAGTISAIAQIPDTNCDRQSWLTTSRETGCLHVLTQAEQRMLLTATCDERGITERYSVEVNEETILIQDAGGRRVAALTLHDEGIDVALLGPEPPELPRRPEREVLVIPNGFDVVGCDRPSGLRNAGALALAASWRNLPHGEILRQIREMERQATSSPEPLVEALFALRDDPKRTRFEEALRLTEHLTATFPGHPEVRLLRANQHAREEEWAEARAALEGLLPGDFDERRAMHLHHLRALVAFHEGRLADVATESAAARLLEGSCSMQSLEDLAEIAAPAGGTRPALARLADALRHADERLAAGDAAGALAAIDVPVVWNARELQSLARMAEAHLGLSSETFEERLRKRVTLGAFLDCHARRGMLVRNLSSLPGAWRDERLEDTATRARAWLDRLE